VEGSDLLGETLGRNLRDPLGAHHNLVGGKRGGRDGRPPAKRKTVSNFSMLDFKRTGRLFRLFLQNKQPIALKSRDLKATTPQSRSPLWSCGDKEGGSSPICEGKEKTLPVGKEKPAASFCKPNRKGVATTQRLKGSDQVQEGRFPLAQPIEEKNWPDSLPWLKGTQGNAKEENVSECRDGGDGALRSKKNNGVITERKGRRRRQAGKRHTVGFSKGVIHPIKLLHRQRTSGIGKGALYARRKWIFTSGRKGETQRKVGRKHIWTEKVWPLKGTEGRRWLALKTGGCREKLSEISPRIRQRNRVDRKGVRLGGAGEKRGSEEM